MDLFHGLLRFIDHNRFTCIGLLVAVLASSWLVGCAPRTASPTTGEAITRTELAREVAGQKAAAEAFVAKVEIADADLAAKEEFRASAVNTLGALGNAAAAGTITPAAGINAVVTLLLGGLAAGGVANSKRKDKVIDVLKGK